jgi:hypothetical protein
MSRRRTWLLAAIVAGSLAIAGVSAVYAASSASSGDDRTAATAGGASAQALSGSLRIRKADGVAATDFPCTTSTTFVPLPGTAVTWNQGGRVNDEVVSLFQAEWFNTDRGLIQLRIDGVIQSGPGDSGAPMAADSGNDAGSVIDETNGFNFISDPVAPGTHTAQIYWASVAGGVICADERSHIIQHG